MVILLDTSIFIEFRRNHHGPFPELLLSKSMGRLHLITTTPVVFEYWQGLSMHRTDEREKTETLFAQIEVIPLSVADAKLAGQLSRDGVCQGMDAMIAAVALNQKAQLATLNTKHFRTVPDLALWKSKNFVLHDRDWTKSYYV